MVGIDVEMIKLWKYTNSILKENFKSDFLKNQNKAKDSNKTTTMVKTLGIEFP